MHQITLGQESAGATQAGEGINPQTPTRLYHRNDIDGLRAIAVLAVIANHIDKRLLPGGFLGVDIFFAISGYVITSSLLSRHRQSFAPFILSFYERRVRRIVPALVFCVLLTFLTASLFIPPGSDLANSTWRTGIWALVGGSNIYLSINSSDYFSTTTALNPFTQTWSLGVEEQFYLIFPLLFFAATEISARSNRFKNILPVLIGATGAISLALYISTGTHHNWSYYFSPFRYWEIAAGCLACCLRNQFLNLRQATRSQLPLICFTTCLCGLVFFSQTKLFGTISVVISTAVLLASNKPGDFVYEALGSRLLRPIGLGSYSLYLWHWSALVLARWTIGISSLTLPPIILGIALISYASYKWIETPSRRRPWLGSEAGTLGIGLSSLILTGSAIAGLRAETGSPLYLGKHCKPEKYQTCVPADSPHPPVTPYISNTAITRDRCQSLSTESIEDRLKECSSIRNHSEPTLVVAGDSFSGALSPAVDNIYQRSRFNLIYLSAGGCHLDILEQHDSSQDCRKLNQRRYEFLANQLKPGDVVLVAASGRRSSLSSNIKTLALLKNALRERKVQLIVQQILPALKTEIPDICYLPRQFYNQSNKEIKACSEVVKQTLASYEHKTMKARQRLRLLDDGKWLTVWDPIPQLCPNGTCSTHLNGVRLYRDNGHLSVKGAQMLSSSLEDLLRRTSLEPTLRPLNLKGDQFSRNS